MSRFYRVVNDLPQVGAIALGVGIQEGTSLERCAVVWMSVKNYRSSRSGRTSAGVTPSEVVSHAAASRKMAPRRPLSSLPEPCHLLRPVAPSKWHWLLASYGWRVR